MATTIATTTTTTTTMPVTVATTAIPPVHQWTIYQVSDWLVQNGYGAYAGQFEAEDVSGDVLLHLMHDTLRDLNVLSVGHRLGILKAIYRLKLEHNIPLDIDDFIPQDIDQWTENKTAKSVAASQNAKIHHVMNEVSHIGHELRMLRDQLLPVLRQIAGRPEPNDPVIIPPNSAGKSKGTMSPVITVSNLPGDISNGAINAVNAANAANAQKRTKPAALNLFSSNSIKEGSLPNSPYLKNETRLANPVNPTPAVQNTNAIRVYGDRLPGRENEAYKALRITLESTSQQILDMALRKYNLMDDGKNYTLFIVHSNRKRYFGLEDRPLKFYQQLQQAGENPMFVMKPNNQLSHPPAIIPPVPPVPPLPSVPNKVEERRPSQSRRKDVRTTIIGSVPPALPGGATAVSAYTQSANTSMNSVQPSRSLNRHRQHGSISERKNTLVPYNVLPLDSTRRLSSSTPSGSGLQTVMNEHFDALLEQWHHERSGH
ncbi:hypothetical protein BDF22DRAFT_696372 [Syncephalis plumigaleata]|nr:hypothetical protein BDF22DRAFT_696372 [Syncephalis plumigaleata]